MKKVIYTIQYEHVDKDMSDDKNALDLIGSTLLEVAAFYGALYGAPGEIVSIGVEVVDDEY